jgi:CRP/FNR family transcriptional regulator, polysaccharide utilization system transcription regulator
MGTLIAPDALKTQLEFVGSRIEKQKSTFLFRRNDVASGVYLILTGQARLGLERDPRGFPSRLIGAGSVLGLPSTLSNSPYSLTAEIVEDSLLIYVSGDILRRLLRDQPQLCFDVMTILTEELNRTRAALERLHRQRP